MPAARRSIDEDEGWNRFDDKGGPAISKPSDG
jgi:hypothetical protein